MLSSTISSTTSDAASLARHVPCAEAALPLRWTPEHIGTRLVEAFRTMDRLPRAKGPRAAGNHWPLHRVEFADRVAEAEMPPAELRERERRRNALAFRPSGEEIARMDRALDWLRQLRDQDADLALLVTLWAFRTARGRTIRVLCREQGWSPPTFYKRRDRALAMLASRLEGEGAAVF